MTETARPAPVLAPTHSPCCSAHGVDMDCATYCRTHFVEARPCCEHWTESDRPHWPATGGPIDTPPNCIEDALEPGGYVVTAAAAKAFGANRLREINAAATDPLTLLLRDHGIGAPDVMADAIHADFVVIPRATCIGTEFGCRWTPHHGRSTVDRLGPTQSTAVQYRDQIREIQAQECESVDAELVSRPLLPELPWEVVDGSSREAGSSVSVANSGQESASTIAAEGAA